MRIEYRYFAEKDGSFLRFIYGADSGIDASIDVPAMWTPAALDARIAAGGAPSASGGLTPPVLSSDLDPTLANQIATAFNHSQNNPLHSPIVVSNTALSGVAPAGAMWGIKITPTPALYYVNTTGNWAEYTGQANGAIVTGTTPFTGAALSANQQLAIDIASGTIYYKDGSGNWQPASTSLWRDIGDATVVLGTGGRYRVTSLTAAKTITSHNIGPNHEVRIADPNSVTTTHPLSIDFSPGTIFYTDSSGTATSGSMPFTMNIAGGDATLIRRGSGGDWDLIYNTLPIAPVLGTAAPLNVPATLGAQASATEVVRGDDPRLDPFDASFTPLIISGSAPVAGTILAQVAALSGDDAENEDRAWSRFDDFDVFYQHDGTVWTETGRAQRPVIEFAQNQLVTAMDQAASAAVTSKFTWVLSNLGYSGTPLSQLQQALAMINALTAGFGTLIVDLDIEITSATAVGLNIPTAVRLLAKDKRVTELSGPVGAIGAGPATLISCATSNITFEGFRVVGNGYSDTLLRANEGTTVLDCDFVDLPAADVFAALTDYGETAGVRSTGIGLTNNLKVIGCNFDDIYSGITLTGIGENTYICKNSFRGYSGRAIGTTTSPTSGNLNIIDNDFYAPASAALTQGGGTATTAIRQPVALQRRTGTEQYIGGIFAVNRFYGTGAPYRTDNPTDSPGGNTDIPSDAAADVFSFHAIKGFSIAGNVANDGGEVGITLAVNSDENTVTGNIVARPDTTGIFVSGIGNTVMSNTVIDAARDQAGDHSAEIGGIQFDNCADCTAAGNSIRSAGPLLERWVAGDTVAVGDRRVIRAMSIPQSTLSGIQPWNIIPAGNFVPGFTFRFARLAGGGQYVYRVPPTGFPGKGAAWDAAEEAKYIEVGSQGQLQIAAEYREYEAVAAHTTDTDNYPAYDVDNTFWSPLTVNKTPYGIVNRDSSGTRLIGNTYDGVYDRVYSENATYSEIVGDLGVFEPGDNGDVVLGVPNRFWSDETIGALPTATRGASYTTIVSSAASTDSAGQKAIATETLTVYVSVEDEPGNYIWRPTSEPGGAAAPTRWQAYTNTTGAAFVNHSNVDSVTVDPDSTGDTNVYEFALLTPLPALNWPIAVTNYTGAGRDFRVTVVDVNTVRVSSWTGNGATATTANFTIQATS